ncbi:hypothetical protein [Hamadaea tsunoensis]|uniref:hypothetical protein n=1 Tax=Hamadaea tsunoensis TaxID=53368 RepID=UPI00041B1099|nr:hypothetical protein [Hamadaea tsunoensis]
MTEQPGAEPAPESGSSTPAPVPGSPPPLPAYPSPPAHPAPGYAAPGYPVPGYPAAGYGVPTGYEVPASAYQPLVPAGYPDPNDPLIAPPNAGIGAWFARVWGTIGRSWKSLAAIFAITNLLPTAALAVGGVLLAALIVAPMERDALASSSGQTDAQSGDFTLPAFALGFILIALVVVLVLLFLQSVGYAAATYSATKAAAGTPVPLGTALGYGFRHGLGLFGWNFVSALLILLGFAACILPSIYVYAATALVGPIYLFERRRPIGRSFSIFNTFLGRILGRLAMTALVGIGFSFVVNILENIANAALGSADTLNADNPAILVPQLIVAGAGAVLTLPATIFQFAAILSTYAEQRGYEAPVRVGQLAAELDA